jgi:hypothetical protein
MATRMLEPRALSLVPTIEPLVGQDPCTSNSVRPRESGFFSLLIVLDGVDVAGGCFIGIESRIASGAALTEEIPALIQTGLQRLQSRELVFGKFSSTLALSQLVLLMC